MTARAIPVSDHPSSRDRNGDDTLPLVRNKVRELLTRSESFRALPKDKRDQIARDMVMVARYMVDAGGETRDMPVAAVIENGGPDAPAARALRRNRPPLDPTANRMGQRGQALADTVEAVDFPGFVSGLIDGVFNAIVKASIDQMEAYATLVQNIAKTADQYMKDNVSEDQARDWLAERYPDHLQPDFDQGRLGVRPDADSSSLPNFAEELGLPFPLDSLNDDTVEQELVPAARKRIAIDRQQLLLTLVLMGINRIVVSDGNISASVVFTLDTDMLKKRHWDRESTFQYNADYSRESNPWFSPKTKFNSEVDLNVTTNQSYDSEDETKLKVTLRGNVDLRFKSETFPLEKMTDMLGLNKADLEARQIKPAAQQPASPGLAPPPPPLPQR